jgi:1-deoxy-D-xylulose-5-phosphate synthase
MSLLDGIRGPEDIAGLSIEERIQLADEIRERIIQVICRTGGHLASSLGVVELTIALLSVYKPPLDKIIWDVGHQIYPWKLLTGRAERFHTIRQSGGLSGFPRRSESEYDCFGTGHASTSISAALGFAVTRDLTGTDEKVAVVIGDGAMGGGMALEGLNNLGHSRTDLTVILNDNEMSISRNVGAMSRHFTKLITDPRYNRLRNDIWNALGKVPSLGERMRKAAHIVSSALKMTIVPDTLFDEFGIRYIGPVPGHDLPALTGVLQRVSQLRGPMLVHLVTTKGKGFEPAECDATRYHGVSGIVSRTDGSRTFTSCFSDKLVELAEKDESIVAITAAMPDGTGLTAFSRKFPGRFFDVGIAEQHAVTFACGLAFGGLKPVVAIYSTFMQRAIDQVIHDAALQKAPLVFAMDRAGFVGEDGPTHHGAFDIPLMRLIPGIRLASPRDYRMLELLLEKSLEFTEYPTAIRYPRGCEPDIAVDPPVSVDPGAGQVLREGSDITLMAAGTMLATALDAAFELEKKGISVRVWDPVWLKPLATEEILRLGSDTGKVVTLEEGSLAGGFGEEICRLFAGTDVHVYPIGLPDSFQPHGSRSELLRETGMDKDSLVIFIENLHHGKDRNS